MPRPTVKESIEFYTTTTAAQELQMTRRAFRERLDKEVLPTPTKVNPNGVKLFDTTWMKRAKIIVMCERGFITPTELEIQLRLLDSGGEHEE